MIIKNLVFLVVLNYGQIIINFCLTLCAIFFLLTLITQGNMSVTFQSLTLVKYISYVKSQ